MGATSFPTGHVRDVSFELFWPKLRRRSIRYGPPTVLPVIAAATAAVAGVSHGPVQVYWTLGAIGATAGNALFNALKERHTLAPTSIARTVWHARTELALGFNRAGEPLVVALGNAVAAPSQDQRRAALSGLMHLVVDLAATRCARAAEPTGNARCVFYQLVDDSTLERKCYAGRQGNSKPRKYFKSGGSLHEAEAVALARGDEVLFVGDLEQDPPANFAHHRTKSYKAFLSVPVKAGDQNFGMLCVDSDTAWSLGDVDRGYVLLLAGLLAAGIAHNPDTPVIEVAGGIPRQNDRPDRRGQPRNRSWPPAQSCT